MAKPVITPSPKPFIAEMREEQLKLSQRSPGTVHKIYCNASAPLLDDADALHEWVQWALDELLSGKDRKALRGEHTHAACLELAKKRVHELKAVEGAAKKGKAGK